MNGLKVIVSKLTGSRRMSVDCCETEPNSPHFPALPLALSDWPLVLNEPANPAAFR